MAKVEMEMGPVAGYKDVDAAVAHHIDVRRALARHAPRIYQRVQRQRMAHYDQGRVSIKLRRGYLLDWLIDIEHPEGEMAAASATHSAGLLGAAKSGRITPRMGSAGRRRSGRGMNARRNSSMNRRPRRGLNRQRRRLRR